MRGQVNRGVNRPRNPLRQRQPLRRHRSLVALADLGIEFFAQNAQVKRTLNAEAHLAGRGLQHDQADVVPNADGFTGAARQNEHASSPAGRLSGADLQANRAVAGLALAVSAVKIDAFSVAAQNLQGPFGAAHQRRDHGAVALIGLGDAARQGLNRAPQGGSGCSARFGLRAKLHDAFALQRVDLGQQAVFTLGQRGQLICGGAQQAGMLFNQQAVESLQLVELQAKQRIDRLRHGGFRSVGSRLGRADQGLAVLQ